VNELCLLLGYTRQSFYQGIKDSQKQAYQEDIVIEEVLRHRKLQKRLGTRKLLGEMKEFLDSHKFKIGRDALFTLLNEKHLLVRRRRRSGPVTTLSKHHFRRYRNIIRDFVPTAPNQLWVSDITYIKVDEGFAYLSLITDAYSRKIVGYSLRENLSARGPLLALKMALLNNPEHEDLIHHSDRGVQYCCDEYVSLLLKSNIKISMTENGDPLENAIAERVNGILKQELLKDVYPDFHQAQKDIQIACSTYNYLRPHGSINNLKPIDAHQMQGLLKRRWKNYYRKRTEVSMI
jgi:putative transposase